MDDDNSSSEEDAKDTIREEKFAVAVAVAAACFVRLPCLVSDHRHHHQHSGRRANNRPQFL